MKLMTFVYIGIAIVFLATIIIMLLQKYSPTKGKRQTRRGIIALACWGLGIALIFFGTEHYMASAASIVIVAAIIVIMLRAIGKMTEGMSPEEAEATLIESQENGYNSVFAGCDSAEKREKTDIITNLRLSGPAEKDTNSVIITATELCT